MSRKTKSKRKHGQTIDTVEFLSPLSVAECTAHLKAGHSPIKKYRLDVDIEGESFQIEWIDPFYRFRHTYLYGDKNPGTWRKGESRWSAPVWLEGTLTPTDSGLVQVCGRVLREPGASNTARIIRLGLILALWMVVSGMMATYLSDRALWAWWLLAGVVLVLLVADFASRTRTLDHLTRGLLDYLRERLDVQRG